jgi:hypothetical protein
MLSLIVIRQNISDNLYTISVPKTAVPYGETPKIFLNNQVASDQGFSQDSNSYDVWYKTASSSYELSIVFSPNGSLVEFPLASILAIVVIIIFSLSIAAVFLKRKKGSLAEDIEYSTYS